MPKPRGKSRRPARDVYKWIGHIEVFFTEIERTRAIEYIGGAAADFEDVLSRLTQQEITVKFTYEVNEDHYRIVLQPKAKHCYLRGYSLGFSHIDLSRLLLIGQYICEVMITESQITLPNRQATNDW